MPSIPLRHFVYERGPALPFMIERTADLPPLAWASTPNRHSFFELFWVTAGAGLHHIDFQAHPVRPPCLFCVAPGQVHLWELSTALTGYAILFPREFLQLSDQPQLLAELTLLQPGSNPGAIYPPHASIAQIDARIQQLYAELHTPQLAQLAALQALMQLLLIDIQRRIAAAQPAPPPSAASQLTKHFLALVEQHYAQHAALDWYAAQLGVSPGHLSEMVKAVTGSTAGASIRRRIALEARRLLVHTDHTVAAIALALGFSDPAYFARFCRRETGSTPLALRQQFREKYQLSRS